MKSKVEITRLAIACLAMLLFSAKISAQKSILGTTDINAFIEEAPGLPNSLSAAANRAYGANALQPDLFALDNYYKPFEEKVNLRIDVYKQYAQDKMENSGDNSEAAYQAQAIKDANSNPIIANMGGAEKVSKMTEEEARVAATQAAAQYTANPFAANGIQSEGMTALYQKIISDPAYAKKFEKMSEAEKEAELRKFMANDQAVVKTPAEMAKEHQQFEQQQKEANLVRNAQEIQLKITQWSQQIGDAGMAYGLKASEIAQSPGNHQEIEAEFRRQYDAIPLVVIGEGKEKDPDKVVPLRIATAEKHRQRAANELQQYSTALNELANRYQPIVSDYLIYLEQNGYKINSSYSAKNVMHGTNTELPLISFESSLIGLALDLSNQSKHVVKETAHWEKHYLEVTASY